MYDLNKCTLNCFSELVNNFSIDFIPLLKNDIPDYVILYNSQPIGLIKLSVFSQCPHIEWFEIFEPYRGQQHGKRFIAQLVDEIKCCSSYLYVTPIDENVEIFWRKCGFINSFHPMLKLVLK